MGRNLLFILFYSLYTLPAQPQSFSSKLYTTADGLSDNYIFSIYQDSYGYIWIGTANGLNRYDGKRFITFGLKNGLPSTAVDRIFEDSQHRLWIGTRRGISEFIGDSCYTYPTSDSMLIGYVSSFLEISPGKLWAATDKGLYELKNKVWLKLELYPGFKDQHVSQIVNTSHGMYINYNGNRLVRKLNENYELLYFKNSDNPYFNGVYQRNDTVYLSTYSGLFRLEKNNLVRNFEDTLKRKFIYISYRDKNNRFWFGTKQDGVLVASKELNNNKFLKIPLSFNLVSNFFEDKDNNMWIAGYRGLLKVKSSPYTRIEIPEFINTGYIRHNIISPDGKVIVSGDHGKLAILEPGREGNGTKVVKIIPLKHNSDFIDHYSFDDKNRMWFTTRYKGLYRLDGFTLTNYNHLINPRNNQLRDVDFNKRTGQLYVCGDSVLLVGDENKLDTFFTSANEIIPLPVKIHIDETANSMLVQSLQKGVVLVNGKVKRNLKEIKIYNSIHVTELSESYLWSVYPGHGIFKYRWRNGEIPVLADSITAKEGLNEKTITGIAADSKHRLWIAAIDGISLLRKEGPQWFHHPFNLNVSGTFQPLSFTKISVDRDDQVWLNAENKMFILDPEKITIAPAMTNTVIEKVLLFNRAVKWALKDSVSGYMQLPQHPILKYNQNTISINFNGLQFNDNAFVEYSYRLHPADKGWSEATENNSVSFYQLSPGKYRFDLRSRVKGFAWSAPTSFSFEITKPFWNTIWFRLVLIFIAAAIIYFVFRKRLQQVKSKAEIKDKLHELEMKALKTQMNPHFVHNALNSIQSLIMNNKSEEAGSYISKFAKLLRQVFENSEKNNIPLEKELYSLRLYVDIEKLRLSMDVEYAEIIEPGLYVSAIMIPPFILQPFVENSLWHGLSNKAGMKSITLKISSNEEWLICEITDNGIGRPMAAKSIKPFPEGSMSKAVHITRERLFGFNKFPEKDPVQFIDLVDENGPIGTSVVIQLRAL